MCVCVCRVLAMCSYISGKNKQTIRDAFELRKSKAKLITLLVDTLDSKNS